MAPQWAGGPREEWEWAGGRMGKRRRGKRVCITSEQHNPTPPYRLTPPPLHLGRCSRGSPPPPSFSHTAILHGTPEIKPQTLSFGVLAQNLPPGLALSNAQPPSHLRAIFPHQPPPSTTTYCHFTRHARNRATMAWIQAFGPNPAPRPLVGEGAAPAAASMPSTHTHHFPLSLHTTVSRHTPKTKL